MTDILYRKESYLIAGLLMEVHTQLGPGFVEIVYKDALEYEFKKQNIHYTREQGFDVIYKGTTLPHFFYADFVIMDKIILEIKAKTELHPVDAAQIINYLKVSGNRLGLLTNFGETRLVTKRYVL